jgi:membrane dipeptidase
MLKLQSLVLLFSVCILGQPDIDSSLYQKAVELSKEILIVDTHIDLPDWIFKDEFNITQISFEDQFDFIRSKQGGLNLAFLAIFTSPKTAEEGRSKQRADTLINIVRRTLSKWTDNFKLINSVDEIDISNNDVVHISLGMENGSPIENNTKNLSHYFNEGIRYITLTHYKNNLICDSANDSVRTWNGLSNFGKEVIKEMNRLGIMIDVSHISDSAFYNIIKITKAPLIASHSACRYFTPGFERNISDEMIIELAKTGGVIQIPFADFFLREDANKKFNQNEIEINKYLNENRIMDGSEIAAQFENQYWEENPLPKSSVVDVANHIDYIVKLVGVDYVGVGSDFNGVRRNFLTQKLEDCSKYPYLIYELLVRNYSTEEIKKIMGGNILRVWKQVEEIAKSFDQLK